jgi:hypothetical protein
VQRADGAVATGQTRRVSVGRVDQNIVLNHRGRARPFKILRFLKYCADNSLQNGPYT